MLIFNIFRFSFFDPIKKFKVKMHFNGMFYDLPSIMQLC
jgi:hypothetical protein